MSDQAPRALFDELAAALLDQSGISQKRLFGRDGLRSGDTFFAFFDRDRLVLKLPETLAATLVANGQAAVVSSEDDVSQVLETGTEDHILRRSKAYEGGYTYTGVLGLLAQE